MGILIKARFFYAEGRGLTAGLRFGCNRKIKNFGDLK